MWEVWFRFLKNVLINQSIKSINQSIKNWLERKLSKIKISPTGVFIRDGVQRRGGAGMMVLICFS